MALAKLFTGDVVAPAGRGIAPYRSGPQFVAFFNKFGFDDSYGPGFPSRWSYAEVRRRRSFLGQEKETERRPGC